MAAGQDKSKTGEAKAMVSAGSRLFRFVLATSRVSLTVRGEARHLAAELLTSIAVIACLEHCWPVVLIDVIRFCQWYQATGRTFFFPPIGISLVRLYGTA